MAYTTIDNPELFFQTKLYSGTGSSQSVTLDGDENMQPDWVWGKGRTLAGYNHGIVDSVRGVSKLIYSNLTDAEDTYSTGITSLNTNGFTTGSGNVFNNGSNTYVAWNWKAGTSFSNDASATGIGTIDSSGSVNTDAGISIMSYTGNGSNSASFAHGLGVKPQMVLIKNRSTAKNWVYWQDTTGNGTSDIRLVLNLTNSNYNNYHVTFGTTTITLGNTDDAWNKSGDDLIAYVFAEKKGYSKFGTYTGTGVDSGPFSYCGFKPSFVLTKRTDTSGSWVIQDNKRPGYNETSLDLNPNNNEVEEVNNGIDMLSNGFKQRNTDAHTNASGGTYIFLAFAESPFTNSNGVPCNAR